MLDDASPLVRGAAVWALGRLDRARLEIGFAERRAAETDPDVAAEWDAALAKDEAPMAMLICFRISAIPRSISSANSATASSTSSAPCAVPNAPPSSMRASAAVCSAFAFDGTLPTPEVKRAIAEADAALVSIPQTENGDPVLAAFGNALTDAKRLRSVVYLSTVGVYGDHAGAWVDEETPPRPKMARSRERLAAELAWQNFGVRSGVPTAILRLAGIYGPGRNAFTQIARGDARRIVKPGQVFNRIHVDDIVQAIDAALRQKASGIFNVADDEPCPPGDPLAFAAQLLETRPATRNILRTGGANHVAARFELLAGLPARAQ